MSISSRITQMEQHIGNAYDKIEDLGIDLTDVDKNIDNISSMLENVWNEYPKVTASDVEEATLNGTKKGRMEIDLKGNTKQAQYEGYNLCYNAQISQSVEINFQFIREYIEKTFTISCITNETLAGNSIYLDKGQGGSVYIGSISGSANTRISTTITLADEVFEDLLNSGWYKIRIYKSNGNFQLVENAQIENGTNLKSYEPYCGGIPSPNPSFPQDIYNVTGNNNVKIQNKNLFDFEYVKNHKSNFYRGNSFFAFYELDDVFKSQFTVTTILKGTSQNLVMGFLNTINSTEASQSNYRNINKETINSPKTYDYTNSEHIYLVVGNGNGLSQDLSEVDAFFDNYNIQVELGSTATSYVAHQEQNLPFSLKSKNLFDIENLNFSNGYYDNNGNFISNNNNGAFDFIKVKPNTNYIFSLSSNVYNISIVEFNNLKTFIKRNQISNDDKNEVLLDSETNYIRITINLNNAPTVTKEKVKELNPQLEQGTTATDYEPYYDIKAMEGTTLEDDGIHQKRKQTTLGNVSDLQSTTLFGVLCKFAAYSLPNAKSVGRSYNFLSNKIAPANETYGQYKGYRNGRSLYVITDENDTVENFNSKISGSIVEYELATEEIIPYNSTQQTQYNAIKQARSYDDQTNISQTNEDLPFILDMEALKK